ncbi:MAG: hypothetical protein A2233_04840 [Candidatus Kerfeldbacteria bacterium RIFOXYA2_FULL_38_24]|nr:MAG: hypothetical protein A2233_04840 [Candidatus Kerfeldbacteria bacterium RIFOXYA2_FULL_38_24]OGY89217.1 MAG: hypothetical protein A2458_01315 [Candidatus Kerfeldbacteria bacterium RIFOXYC2_FULL_38_9]
MLTLSQPCFATGVYLRTLGEISKKLFMNKLEKFIINPTNEFHILRHFRYVDDYYKKTLIGQLYWFYDYGQKKFVSSKISQIDIENALKTIGTKFEKNIIGIESPKKPLEIIKNRFQELLSNNKIYWIDNLEYKTIAFTFDYQFFVGQMNCLNKDSILERDKNRIKPVLKSKCAGENAVIVNTISDIELSSTKSIHVEIVETKQLPFYTITAFPDCSLSDDIPDENIVFVV